MLLIHSIFDVAFILFFFLLYVQYTYSGFVTKLTSSALRIEVSSVFDLEKGSISKTLLQVFKRQNDLMQ